jgi:hypothetical protein
VIVGCSQLGRYIVAVLDTVVIARQAYVLDRMVFDTKIDTMNMFRGPLTVWPSVIKSV